MSCRSILGAGKGAVRELSDLLTNEASGVQLDIAALQIARIEHPDLDPRRSVKELDRIAFEIAKRTPDLSNGRAFVDAANRYLFEELGFRGNESEYYDPRNSCLNDVLERRTGIPITLSLVYMEAARRLAKPVFGIGLPGHFIIQYEDGIYSTFIDPFHGGKLLSRKECIDLARRRGGLTPEPRHFEPCSRKDIAVRMLRNLKGAYVRARAFEKAVNVLDLIVAALPDAAEERKQRAVVNLHLKRWWAAKTDFDSYLTLAPNAPDCEEVKTHAQALQQYLSTLN
jgi:regulator of sirC expression with transglutaminase-like and TPR domain